MMNAKVLTSFWALALVAFANAEDTCPSANSQTKWVNTCTVKTPTTDSVTNTIDSIYNKIKEAECKLANPADYPEHYSPCDREEFDFIVVGSGSAGAVVASRLSENPEWNVLLLEAGGNPTKTTEVPGIYGNSQGTENDWAYRTDSEEDNCLAMNNHSCAWPRGKILGGTSQLNANLYVRGNPRDFDHWASLGNDGWDYESVLHYFKKSEDIRAQEVLNTPNHDRYHGHGGHLTIETWKTQGIDTLVEVFSQGMNEMGYPTNADCNGETQLGFTTLQGTLMNGTRCSTAKAFLSPAKDRTNLKVSKHSFVTQVLIDNDSKTAYGVKFVNGDGDTIEVTATKEVIVSGGAINSPQLLMLSGVGPREHLEEHGINVVQDLQVGKNLQDHHLYIGLTFSYNYTRPTKTGIEHMYDFLTTDHSKYLSPGLLTRSNFINTLDHTVNYPDIQTHHFDFDVNDSAGLGGTLGAFNMRKEIADSYHKINEKRYMNLIMLTMERPESRGEILLTSSDPMAHPKIRTGALTHQADIDTFQRAIDFVERWSKAKAMKKIDTKFHEVIVPQCAHHRSKTQRRACNMKYLTATTFHPASSCKMGPASDANAVVDHTLKVHGINNLRVADASIMPYIVTANTNAATIMIGEKAADLIKADWS